MTILKRSGIALACALAYYVFFTVNKLLFDSLEFSYGVNWISIPAGVQLLLVLVAHTEGALGIALATFFIGIENRDLDYVFHTFITAVISGASPLLTRKICFDFWHIDEELANITLKALVKISIAFAFMSASFHQLWFVYIGKSEAFLQSLSVMTFGNLFGTALVLISIRLLASKFPNGNSSRD